MFRPKNREVGTCLMLGKTNRRPDEMTAAERRRWKLMLQSIGEKNANRSEPARRMSGPRSQTRPFGGRLGAAL